MSLSINPYHLGFTLWEEIIEQSGVEAAAQVMREDDDFSFLRNHLTREIAAEMGMFRYQRQRNGPIKVVAADVDELHESLLLDKYNFGAPRVAVARCATTARWCSSTTPARRPGARSRSARARCSSTSSAYGGARCCSTRIDAAAKAVVFSSESAAWS